jgi:hypothetical protein
MNSINELEGLNQSLKIERIFSDEQGATLQDIMEYLLNVLTESNNPVEKY